MNEFKDTQPLGDCQWCAAADFCGAAEGKPPAQCPMRGDAAPTVMDVMRLLLVMQTSLNQRFAQLMLLINRHGHAPDDRK